MNDKNISIQSLLGMDNGKTKAKELGLENKFEAEIQRLRKKLPSVTFQELTLLQRDAFAQQPPITLEKTRVQFLWIRYGQKGETKEIYLEKYRKGEFDYIYKNR